MTDIVEAAARAREEDPRLRWGNDMFVEAEPVQVYVSEREMVSNLRLLGLPAVTAEGLSLIHRQISREKNPLEALKTLAQKLRAHAAAHGGASSSAVDKDAVMEVIAAETRNEEDTRQDAYSVVSSFDFPRWGYDAARKSYFWLVASNAVQARLHGLSLASRPFSDRQLSSPVFFLLSRPPLPLQHRQEVPSPLFCLGKALHFLGAPVASRGTDQAAPDLRPAHRWIPEKVLRSADGHRRPAHASGCGYGWREL